MLFHSHYQRDQRIAPADLKAARRGDLPAFNRLVAAHQDEIYTLSYRALGDEQQAGDAARAAVAQAFVNIAGWREGEFKLWLLRWVVLACQERLRTVSLTGAIALRTAEPGTAQALQDRLCHLPAEPRMAIVLVDVAGLDYAEAAAVLGNSRERVCGCVADARRRLTLTSSSAQIAAA